MNRTWGIVGGVSGAAAVAAGAFGAHGLKSMVGAEALTIFETAARNHMYHTLAIVAVAVLVHAHPSRAARLAGPFFLICIAIFSGSLYAMALSDMRWRFLGAATPFGGVCMIVGWIQLAVGAAKGSSQRRSPDASS